MKQTQVRLKTYITYIFFNIIYIYIIERHRRSKHEQEGRIYQCDCGKSYLSQPALNNHKKTKHPETLEGVEKRGRGRPRKYLPNAPGDFESNKFDTFFNNENRQKGSNEINIDNVIKNVFDFIYSEENKKKFVSQPKDYNDISILKNLKENVENNTTKEKKDKTCDEVFYEYLHFFKEKTNEEFYTLMIKFILLFRECFNNNKNKGKEADQKENSAAVLTPEGLPELCNEFYSEFMEPNNFFGLSSESDKSETIELIQHFCIWLFKNDYTKSKLSLANN